MAHKSHENWGKTTQDMLDHMIFNPTKRRTYKHKTRYRGEVKPLNPDTRRHKTHEQPEIPVSDPEMAQILRNIANRKLRT